jgi:glycosyltransferase involved in cell wall biosynthesis
VRIAVNAWFLDQPGTGSGQYLRGLLRAMPDLAPDHEFLLVLPARPAGLQLPGLNVETAAYQSRLWQSNLGKVLFEQIAFPRACRRWGAQVAHVPYWGSALWPAVPTVVTIHDLIPLLLPAYRGGPLVRLYTRLVSASARRAALILTDSLASKRDIEACLGLPPERIRSIYLAQDEQFAPGPAPDDPAIRDGYGLPARYILYLAGHDVRKNVAGMVKAFDIVARADGDVSLVIGGRLPARADPPFFDPRPLIASLDLGSRVCLTGWVEESHKPALYRGAACAVFPSYYEGFGLPVLEALACGTPLVTSHAGSLPELAGDAAFALDPDDVPGLAGAILACLTDERLVAGLRQRGPAQAARFTWAQAARETLAAYEEAASCAS